MKKLLSIILLIGLVACEDDPVNQALLENNPIDISGEWSVSRVYLNEVEITDNFNFSSFRLTLNRNGETPSSFSIASDRRIPFITNLTDGMWALDDLVYPSQLMIVEGENTMIGEFAEALFPINNTTMALEFSLGCSDNTYIYHFTKN